MNTSNSSKSRRLMNLVLSTAILLPLAACGGGGEAAAAQSASGASVPDACPHAQLTDAWIDHRLGCLAVGQRMIDISSGAAGTRADRAFVIRQETLDTNWNNALPSGSARYFRHFICMRNAPANLTPQYLATDLSVAIGTSNFSSSKPPQVTAISLTVAGGNQPGWTQTSCDARLHPVIVDYDSRLVESINPGALTAIQVYDL